MTDCAKSMSCYGKIMKLSSSYKYVGKNFDTPLTDYDLCMNDFGHSWGLLSQ